MITRILAAAVAALAAAAAANGCAGGRSTEGWRLVLTEESPLPGVVRADGIGVGDFDRDGQPDLALMANGGEIHVLLNRGSVRFEPSAQGPIPVGRGASGLGVGDVDGDGASDLVVCHHDDFEILVLLSGGDGSFHAAPWSPQLSALEGKAHSHNLALADVDGDGRLDLVQAHSERNVVVVLLGDGSGRFSAAPGSPFAAGRHPYTVALGDFDADGRPDFAVPNAMGGDLTVGLGQGGGRFSAAPGAPIELGVRPLGLTAGDVNADGHVDLVANLDDASALDLWLGDGTGSFRRAHALAAPGGRPAIHDLDRDGVDDVIAPVMDPPCVAVWFGRREGAIDGTPRTFDTPGTDSQVMTVADLNGDGALDVVTAGWDVPTMSILLGRKD